MDTDYYDYDYEKPSARVEAAMNEVKSDAELAERLKGIGFAVKSKLRKPLNADELQAEVMAEMDSLAVTNL